MENGSFLFSALFIPPIWTRGVFGNEFLARVDWCQLEPAFHFPLDSKRNLSRLMGDVEVFV